MARKHGPRRRWTVLIPMLLLAGGCTKATGPGGPPSSSTSTGTAKTVQTLKLDVLAAVGGHLAYCDPDVFPVGHGTPLQNAQARFPTILADRPALEAILAHERFSSTQNLSGDQLIAINEDYKKMQAIDLQPAGDHYSFSVLVLQNGSDVGIWRLVGTVSHAGSVTIERREVGQRPNCPVCLAAGVRIDTPNGRIPVQDIQVGMPVWTTDRQGSRFAGVVLETGHMEAPLGHEVARLTLADRRMVVASPGHPTADGRTVGDLQPGDSYDGSVVASVALIPYAGTTWDFLPSGPTGTYFANGVLLGSTLALARVIGTGRLD